MSCILVGCGILCTKVDGFINLSDINWDVRAGVRDGSGLEEIVGDALCRMCGCTCSGSFLDLMLCLLHFANLLSFIYFIVLILSPYVIHLYSLDIFIHHLSFIHSQIDQNQLLSTISTFLLFLSNSIVSPNPNAFKAAPPPSTSLARCPSTPPFSSSP
jgi:hypothetical protein